MAVFLTRLNALPLLSFQLDLTFQIGPSAVLRVSESESPR